MRLADGTMALTPEWMKRPGGCCDPAAPRLCLRTADLRAHLDALLGSGIARERSPAWDSAPDNRTCSKTETKDRSQRSDGKRWCSSSSS